MAHSDKPTEHQIHLLRALCQQYAEPYPAPELMSRGSVGIYIRKIQNKHTPNHNKKLVTVIKVYNDGSTVIENRR